MCLLFKASRSVDSEAKLELMGYIGPIFSEVNYRKEHGQIQGGLNLVRTVKAELNNNTSKAGKRIKRSLLISEKYCIELENISSTFSTELEFIQRSNLRRSILFTLFSRTFSSRCWRVKGIL